MALRIPTRDELQRLAQSHDLTLSPDEAEGYQSVLADLFPLLEQLDAMPEPPAPRPYPQRDPGGRPERPHDPSNASVRRCSVVGAAQGPLAGTRVGLKDNVCLAGIPMTAGSRVVQGLVPETDATIGTRLLAAGARLVAALTMDDLAFSGAGDTRAYEPTLNPHSLHHLAGGSAGGSAAALSYEDIDLTIGGDQGGAIRLPAAWCGVVGLKPTHSLVPSTGMGGIDQTVDHAGPMARRVADVAQTLEGIAGKDPRAPRQEDVPVQSYTAALGQDLRGVRVGLRREGCGQEGAEPDVEAAVRAAIDTIGLPVGGMLTGRRFDEAPVLAVAPAFERQVDGETR